MRAILTVGLVAVLLACATATPEPARAQEGPVAFVDVTVVPMDRYGSLDHQTVLVRDGIIQEVDDADDVEVPDDARVVPGDGRFLIPGLAEMHAHLPGPDADPEWVEDLLFLYVANGVTTIRGMLGHPAQFALRHRVMRGDLPGPSMYLAAPSINGTSAPTPDSVETLVRRYTNEGWDLLKIHPGLTREVWDRMVETAIDEGITFGGHVPTDVGLRHALATGVSTVDHLDGYVREVASDAVRARVEDGEEVPLAEIVEAAEPRKIRAIAGRTRAANARVVPTMRLWEILYRPMDADSLAALPEMRYVPPEMLRGWLERKRGGDRLSPEAGTRLAEVRNRVLKALNDAGVDILMGTDSPQLFSVPGFSLHRELEAMAEAGLANYEILLSGTSNVARYAAEELGEPGDFGTVEPGNRADLLLLDGDPLASLDVLREPAGIMLRGRWIPGQEIRARLEAMAEKYGG